MAQRYAGLRCVSRRKIEWLPFIVLVMIGVQFIRHFNGLLNKLGWGMLASLIIFISAAALISEDEFSMTNAIVSFIVFWIDSYVLYIQAELLAD